MRTHHLLKKEKAYIKFEKNYYIVFSFNKRFDS